MKLATKLPSTIAKKAMKKPTEIATKTRQALDKKKSQPQDFTLEYGGQDPMDIISYAGLEEQPDHLILDGRYIRTIFISGYPFVASSGCSIV